MAVSSPSIAENSGAAERVKEVFPYSFTREAAVRQLESKDLVAQIHFLVSVADIFNPFLKFFQTEEPLVHLLYDQLATLLAVLLGRFIRKDLLANKSTRKLSKICLEVMGILLAYTELEI